MFYGDSGGQLYRRSCLRGDLSWFRIHARFVFNLFVDWMVGQRVSAKSELEGLIFQRWVPSLPRIRAEGEM